MFLHFSALCKRLRSTGSGVRFLVASPISNALTNELSAGDDATTQMASSFSSNRIGTFPAVDPLRSSRTRRAVLHNAAAFGLLGVTGLLAPVARANSLRVGQPAPPATLVTLDGKRLASRDFLGRVVILTFLATWCEPCRDELPLLSAYQQAHAAQGLTVLGFSLDESDHLDEVRALAAPLHFPVGLLSASQAPGYGRIWHIPVSFTIDRAGRLADDGWKDKHPVWTAERLERVVAPLLT